MNSLPLPTKEKIFILGFVLLILGEIIVHFNNHVAYILNTVALICFISNIKISLFKKLTTTNKVLYSFLFIYNLVLILRLVFNHKGYSLESYLFHPYLIQTILLFLLTLYRNNNYILKLFKWIPFLAFLSIIIFPFSIDISIKITNCYIYIYIIYINFVAKKSFKEIFIFLITSINMYINIFILDNRLILLYILLMQIAILIIKYLPVFKSALWAIYISIPFIFVYLLFNLNISLLDTSNYISEQNNQSTITADTRTFLYYDLKNTLETDNTILYGEGLNGKVLTSLQAEFDSSIDKTGRRQFIECNILDLARRGGIIYVILYLAILITASYKLLRCNNKILQSLSFYIASFVGGSIIGFTHIMSIEIVLLMFIISIANSTIIKK